jgi:hypothetical protein
MEAEATRLAVLGAEHYSKATSVSLLERLRAYPDLIKAAISQGNALQICMLSFCPTPLQCAALLLACSCLHT